MFDKTQFIGKTIVEIDDTEPNYIVFIFTDQSKVAICHGCYHGFEIASVEIKKKL